MMATDESDNGGAPATYREALLGPEGKEWQKAFDAHENENEAGSLVWLKLPIRLWSTFAMVEVK